MTVRLNAKSYEVSQKLTWQDHHTHKGLAWRFCRRSGVVLSISITRRILVGAIGQLWDLPAWRVCFYTYWLLPIQPPYFMPTLLHTPHIFQLWSVSAKRMSTNTIWTRTGIKIRLLFCGCWRVPAKRLRKNIGAGIGMGLGIGAPGHTKPKTKHVWGPCLTALFVASFMWLSRDGSGSAALGSGLWAMVVCATMGIIFWSLLLSCKNHFMSLHKILWFSRPCLLRCSICCHCRGCFSSIDFILGISRPSRCFGW